MYFEKVKEVIADTLNLDENLITETASLRDDLGIDSLDAVELSLALEEAFEVTIPQEELEKFVAVSDILACLETVKK